MAASVAVDGRKGMILPQACSNTPATMEHSRTSVSQIDVQFPHSRGGKT